MTGSLKGRMIRALVWWVLCAWSISLGTTYIITTNSQTSNWDDKLQSIAIKLLQMTPADAHANGAALQARPEVVASNDELTFQVWGDGKRLLASTPGAPRTPLRADFHDGFSNVGIGGQNWRVYAVSDRSGRFQVQVGHDRSMINTDFQKHSLKAVSLAALGMACAGLMMWWAVSRALKPLAKVEQATRGRSRFDLTPLPTGSLPSELLPLVDSFNHVLAHLDQAINAERQFISDAAHELRTPLAALQAQLEVAMRARTDEDRSQALRKVLVGVQRSSRLSDQLLDMARLEAGNRAPLRARCDLKDIVRHVASEFDFSASRLQRSIELALEPCPVWCDVDEIGILLRNLVDNALRYTFPGGRVRISCGLRGDGDAGKAFLEVADDGPGVPAAEQDAIFIRFYRVAGNGNVRGSGIGLSLVGRIASTHHAWIETGAGFGDPGFSVRLLFPPCGAPA
ncbi:ATP-binding protein [Janthinobacterium agaricidamnosum]|uniref:histidine kinase n=1 Tax=Janthinobacterium agaricidamnosum NBRC 102515 = DSM 9628 TaxID=1349767 RepID=W0VET6_9BURK|nr:ATP-binding protein [Janthinobacterium agaricidamnosum]CDG85928.1 HAMP domain protein [Janthinobacterium agaricidamnosum NBRC 102515 = DSM 9628]